MTKSKILICLAVAIAVVMGVLYGKGLMAVHQGMARPDSLKVLALEKTPKAPPADVRFVDAAGGSHVLDAYRGKYVLLNFWATWCAPCVAELPALTRLKAAVPTMTVLAISVGKDKPAAADAFLKGHNAAALGTFVDAESRLMNQFKVFGLPTTLLIDPQGRIIAKAEGPAEWDAPDAVAYFKKLSGG